MGFDVRDFWLKAQPTHEKGWVELLSQEGGCVLALHQAGRAQKSGAAMKIVFGVSDVHAFVLACEKDGLKFGPVHDVGELQFANVKDPAGNSVQVSNRVTPRA